MIKSKEELRKYLNQDRLALNKAKETLKSRIKNIFFPDHIYAFQKTLRKTEYYYNKPNKIGSYLILAYYFVKYKRLGLKLGFSIPLNVFGPGLAIVHYGTIVVNANARVGANCRIHVCTNIGESGGVGGAPLIGNNVYIGPGAKIYGAITIANNSVIAANAAVNKSIVEEGMLIAGVPAKTIKPIEVKNIIKHINLIF
jgi:serine O-acetyltransferase